jgi:hypothetical protein
MPDFNIQTHRHGRPQSRCGVAISSFSLLIVTAVYTWRTSLKTRDVVAYVDLARKRFAAGMRHMRQLLVLWAVSFAGLVLSITCQNGSPLGSSTTYGFSSHS